MTNTDKKTLSNGEVALMLEGLSALLEGDSKSDVGIAVNAMRLGANSKTGKTEKDNEESLIPDWAEDIDNIDSLFIKPNTSIDLWKPITKSYEVDGKPFVQVNYKHRDNIVFSGRTKNEQGLDLKKVDNNFSLDEWELIVEPIITRLLSSIEIRRIVNLRTADKNKFENRIKTMIPQVFKKDEINGLIENEVDITVKEYKDRVNQLLEELNTDPEILISWIKEIIKGDEKSEDTKEPVDEKSKDSKMSKRDKLKSFKKFKDNKLRKSFLAKINKEGINEDEYIEELATKISSIGEQILMLNSRYKEGLYAPQKIKSDYVETPYVKQKLHELSEKIEAQIKGNKGMVNIMGDMGTGKNYIVEHFAAKTNRPFFYFPCSRGMDASDLAFHFEFRNGESMTVPSNLAKGLLTKNACILIDEPNALPPQVLAGLHGLADHNRSFVYNGVTFKAAEGVCIVMAMNPAKYEHVNDLAEAFSDRTMGQDIIIEYPPLTELDALAQKNHWSGEEKQKAIQEKNNNLDKVFICDEALIIKNAIPELKNISEKDFIVIWDSIVNKKGLTDLENKDINIKSIESTIKGILNILIISRAWRRRYEEGQISRTISIRGTISVAESFSKTKDLKISFLNLFKSSEYKYERGKDDYEEVVNIINENIIQ